LDEKQLLPMIGLWLSDPLMPTWLKDIQRKPKETPRDNSVLGSTVGQLVNTWQIHGCPQSNPATPPFST